MTPLENTYETSLPEANTKPELKLSLYSVLAHIYFFFNAVFLPKGLLYTTILSPVFYYRQLKAGRKTWWPWFFLTLFVYSAIHIYSGAELKSLLLSTTLFTLTYFSAVSFYHFFNNYPHLSRIFRQLAVFNFFLALIAIPFLFLKPEVADILWWVNRTAIARHEFPRLKLFTYEASYYSLLMVPLCYYFLFGFMFGQIRRDKYQALFVALIPLLLSMSFGVIGASLMTAFILCIAHLKKLFRYKKAFIITASVLLLLGITAICMLLFMPKNLVVMRFYDILQGTDTSAKGRTTDSFGLAWLIAERKSLWFGCGLGQIKISIAEIVREQYNYWGEYTRYDIPNAMAETLAIFGISGVALKIGLEIYLFFKTRVFSNYYRLALFIFIFIYQFTGSFITNIVEYAAWALAFSEVFRQFDTKPKLT